jgi:glycosyltransferase involved in cell wall biosynthesis
MASRIQAAGGDFRVFFVSGIPSDRGWMASDTLGFDHEFLTSFEPGRRRGRRAVPLNLESRLGAFAPTILLAAGFSPVVAARAARFAGRRGIPYGMWSGEIPSRPTANSSLRARERRWLAERAAFAIAYGWESARYLDSLDADLPVVVGRNTTVLPEAAPVAEREPVRLLSVARAERGKRLDLALDAARELRAGSALLTVIGDGPELERLQLRAATLQTARFVRALPHDQVRRAYEDADVFVFPSAYDIFGLVLIEAMAAGLCLVTSSAPGAVADVVVHRRNALVVGPEEPRAWGAALREVVERPRLRRSLGEAARRTILRRWTIAHAADAMIAGLRLATLNGARA